VLSVVHQRESESRAARPSDDGIPLLTVGGKARQQGRSDQDFPSPKRTGPKQISRFGLVRSGDGATAILDDGHVNGLLSYCLIVSLNNSDQFTIRQFSEI
jgi:hypothetical protein